MMSASSEKGNRHLSNRLLRSGPASREVYKRRIELKLCLPSKRYFECSSCIVLASVSFLLQWTCDMCPGVDMPP